MKSCLHSKCYLCFLQEAKNPGRHYTYISGHVTVSFVTTSSSWGLLIYSWSFCRPWFVLFQNYLWQTGMVLSSSIISRYDVQLCIIWLFQPLRITKKVPHTHNAQYAHPEHVTIQPRLWQNVHLVSPFLC